MDYFILEKTVAALNRVAMGAQIVGCGQPGNRQLQFPLRSNREPRFTRILFVDFETDKKGVYLVNSQLKQESHTLLARSFRNKVSGSYIDSIELPYPDRLVRIRLRLAEWMHPRDLWIEFLGSSSNVTLCDSDSGSILECLSKFPYDRETHPLRMPGRLFKPAWKDSQKKIQLRDLTVCDLAKVRNDIDPSRWILDQIVPMTPLLASKLARLHHQGKYETLTRVIRKVADRKALTIDSNQKVLLFLDNEAKKWSESIRANKERKTRHQLMRPVKMAIKKVKRTISAVERDLEKLPDPVGLRQIADSVASVFHLLKPGMTEIETKDIYSDSQETITVILDPKRNPKDNLDRLYKKANKAERAEPRILERLGELKSEFQALSEVKTQIVNADSDSELDEIEAKLRLAGILTKNKHPQTAMLTRKPYLQFTYSGYRIRVGRNAAENDNLTFSATQPWDFWLHAKGYRGAHVVISNPNKSKVLPEFVTLFAAGLAIYYSKARGENGVEVYLTPKRYVRKAPGNIPGLAIVSRHDTLTANSPQKPPDEQTR